jgi:hypothetical protein
MRRISVEFSTGITLIYNNIKVKVKLSMCFLTKHHAVKAYRGSGGIAPLILSPRH